MRPSPTAACPVARPALARRDLVIWLALIAICAGIITWSFIRQDADTSTRGDDAQTALDRAAGRDDQLARLGHTVGPFSLIDQSGQPFDSARLAGKLWIADFIFTTCPGPCPIMTANLAGLQEKVADLGADRVQFLSITCDPFRDSPEALAAYAAAHGADLANWTFLTGDYLEIQRLAREGFFLPVLNTGNTLDAETIARMQSQAADPQTHVGNVIHSPYFILVGPDGKTVDWYQGNSSSEVARLEADIRDRDREVRLIQLMPALNAALNASATGLLLLALFFIKRRPPRIEAHRWSIVAALLVSVLFLTSYVTYHTLRISATGQAHTTWEVSGFWRPAYYAILISHVVLAALVPFLAVWTLYLGWTRQDTRHRRIAKITFPIWLYVSVTGVIVYFMLYHLHPWLLAHAGN